MTLRRSPSNLLAAFGTATLVGGTVAGIAPGFLTDPQACTIILSRNTPGGTLGFLTAPAANRTPSDTTFTITSTNGADTSSVNWLAIPKNSLGVSAEFANSASLRRSPSGLFVVTGSVSLVAGTKTVNGIAMGPNARVYVMAVDLAGTTGKLSVPSASVLPTSGSFVINSNNASDVSLVAYVVIDQAPRFSPSGIPFSQSRGPLTAGTAVYAGMDPLNQQNGLAVLASLISSTTPGNLSAPSGGAARLNGGITITSSTSEASNLELACF